MRETKPLYITRRQHRYLRLLLDGGERVIMNSSAASILAVVLDLVVATVFLHQSPILAIVVMLVSYPVWWLVSNVITVFCWVMTLVTTAAVSRRYRLFVASRRVPTARGKSSNPRVVLVITDDSGSDNSRWMLLRPAGASDETLLKAAQITLEHNSELPRPLNGPVQSDTLVYGANLPL